MDARELSHYLRDGSDHTLAHRRAVVCLSLGAAATMGLIAAYQVGLIKHIPEPRIKGLNAEKVNASAQAYARLQTPDALLGLGSYAVTAILAAAGGKDRARSHPWLPVAALGKVLFDAANALKLTWDEAVKHRAFCLWCLLATALTLGMVPLAIPEAWEAMGRRQRQRPAAAIRRIGEVVYPWSRKRSSHALQTAS